VIHRFFSFTACFARTLPGASSSWVPPVDAVQGKGPAGSMNNVNSRKTKRFRICFIILGQRLLLIWVGTDLFFPSSLEPNFQTGS
jgi:hypothetical protein